jgi:2-polyprenyl-6-methoxyphenol hydroxylase-like FAD-dependent oxidoreductase
MTSPRILIVGGGIGGLTLAAALGRRGMSCDLIERTAAWAPVGAGITLGVNATRILGELGLLERALECSRTIDRAEITNAGGRVLSTAEFSEAFRGIGVSLAIHRADLHAVLVGGCGSASIRLGTTLKSIEPGAPNRVTFSDGSTGEYDLVVGADGIRSQVRDLGFGERKPVYSGYACWRFIVRASVEPPGMYEMWGRGRRFGIVPLTGDTVYSFATINTPPASKEFASIDVQSFQRIYADFGGPAPAILDALTPETKLIYGDLEEIVLDRWVEGTVGLLGDAAHAMTPNLGQGAAMAIEDASVLAEELAHGGSIAAALARYEKRRRPRVEEVQRLSRRQGRASQSENALVCGLRDLAIRLTPNALAMAGARRLLLKEV